MCQSHVRRDKRGVGCYRAGLVNANIMLELTGNDEATWSLLGTGVGGNLTGLTPDFALAGGAKVHRVLRGSQLDEIPFLTSGIPT